MVEDKVRTAHVGSGPDAGITSGCPGEGRDDHTPAAALAEALLRVLANRAVIPQLTLMASQFARHSQASPPSHGYGARKARIQSQ